jgi:hypothetical protein
MKKYTCRCWCQTVDNCLITLLDINIVRPTRQDYRGRSTIRAQICKPASSERDGRYFALSRGLSVLLRTALKVLGYSHVYNSVEHVDDPSECAAWLHLWHLKQTHQSISAAEFDCVIRASETVTDMPAALFAPELLKAYPDALVVINRCKDIDAWHSSVCSVWDEAAKKRPWFYAVMKLFHSRLFRLAEHEARITHSGLYRGSYGAYRRAGKEVYRDHHAMLNVLIPKGKQKR